MNANELFGHLAYKIANATVHPFPFPHIFVEEVFPWAFYNELLANLPDEDDYSAHKTAYRSRKFANPTVIDAFSLLHSQQFGNIAVSPFRQHIQTRFGGSPAQTHSDLRLVRDSQNYSIGPHTDAPWKILSYLFYLTPDFNLVDHGTSIYLANDPTFRCPGGPHHPYKEFTRIYTAPFVPNSLFAFFKTDYSFHGVEPITIPCQRDVLLWNLYDSVAQNGKTPP